MSSRLMPPNVGAISSQKRTISAASSVSTSMSNTSTSAKRLNSTALPSITGFEASAPRLPSPRIDVPLLMTATRFPRAVYSKASSGLIAISNTGYATPGE